VNFDLDILEARANRCAAVLGDKDWYDDEAAKDLLAPLFSSDDGMARDPDEVADALFLAACDPRAVAHLLDTIKTLMNDDSMLAAQQRAVKSAIESMIAARKGRDEAHDLLRRARYFVVEYRRRNGGGIDMLADIDAVLK
jgi:hypothetical protein